MKLDDPFPNIDAILIELRKLRKAHDILASVWTDLGPYSSDDTKISENTRNNLNKYMEWDDGE